uniref:Pre-rRNA-processing protein IPI1 n=1 Tax=Panagrolaimus sp. PS1159 TaxID=55785 RepID=A0AC35EWP1_9BILA
MGKNKKKSRQHSDFVKPNRKPGKVLKKTNVTDTTFKTKKIELFHQLEDNSNLPPTAADKHLPRLNVQEICQNLNHFQESVLKRALEALLELNTKSNEVFNENLNRIIPAVGRLLAWDNRVQDNYLACLNKVFSKIFAAPDPLISASFDRLCSLLVLGLTNPQDKIKVLAINILNKHVFPRKSAPMNRELFKSFLRLIACDCLTGKIQFGVIKVALSSLPNFLNMYTRDNSQFHEDYVEAFYNTATNEFGVTYKSPTNNQPDFPLDSRGQMDLPFLYPTATKQGLAVLGDACFVFLGRILVIENFPIENFITHISTCLSKINQLIQQYVTDHGVRPGFFGEKFYAVAEKHGLKVAASKLKPLEIHLQKLAAI